MGDGGEAWSRGAGGGRRSITGAGSGTAEGSGRGAVNWWPTFSRRRRRMRDVVMGAAEGFWSEAGGAAGRGAASRAGRSLWRKSPS